MLLFLYIYYIRRGGVCMIRKANLNDVDGIMDIVNQIVVEMKESQYSMG